VAVHIAESSWWSEWRKRFGWYICPWSNDLLKLLELNESEWHDYLGLCHTPVANACVSPPVATTLYLSEVGDLSILYLCIVIGQLPTGPTISSTKFRFWQTF
jgi:hypothetical protein